MRNQRDIKKEINKTKLMSKHNKMNQRKITKGS